MYNYETEDSNMYIYIYIYLVIYLYYTSHAKPNMKYSSRPRSVTLLVKKASRMSFNGLEFVGVLGMSLASHLASVITYNVTPLPPPKKKTNKHTNLSSGERQTTHRTHRARRTPNTILDYFMHEAFLM